MLLSSLPGEVHVRLFRAPDGLSGCAEDVCQPSYILSQFPFYVRFGALGRGISHQLSLADLVIFSSVAL